MADEYSLLIDAADDTEVPFIEAAAVRAGIIWICSADRWRNRTDETVCGHCKRARAAAEGAE